MQGAMIRSMYWHCRVTNWLGFITSQAGKADHVGRKGVIFGEADCDTQRRIILLVIRSCS